MQVNGRTSFEVELQKDVEYIKITLDEIKKNSVTRAEFKPVKSLVYGLVGTVLTGVVTAVVALIIL